jgi:phosphoserine phosphatase
VSDLPWRLVTVDIDATLTTVHGWSVIARAAGRARAYRSESERIHRHGIDEDQHLRVLFGLAEGLSTAKLEVALEATPKVHGIDETVAALRERGVHVALLTHNPSYVIRWYERRFGFEAGSGGWGSVVRRGVVQPPGAVRADKVRGLRLLERRFGVTPSRVAHVGDAWPDARLAPLVGAFLAFNPRQGRVEVPADAVVRSQDLRAILPALQRLRPRRTVKGARPLPEDSNTAGRDEARRADGVRRP